MNNKKSQLWSGLSGIAMLLVGILIAGSVVAFAQAGEINHMLGLSSGGVSFKGTEFTADGALSDAGFEKYIKAAYAFCEQEEEEGSVLLYNKNKALPLNKATEKNVTVFGRGSVDPVFRSTAGGSSSNKQYQKTLADALKDAGFNVNQTVIDAYKKATSEKRSVKNVGEYKFEVFTQDVQNSFAANGDIAFVTLSRFATEGSDLAMSNEKGKRMLELDEHELAMLNMIKSSGKFKKVVIVLNSVFPLELGWLGDYADACLWVGNPGFYGMPGAVRVLTGEKNPSGHTQATYAANSLSAPSSVNFGLHQYDYAGKEARASGANFVSYNEGIYVGYKYYETRYEDVILNKGNAKSAAGVYMGEATWDYAKEVCYPFGFGLSYTTFEYNLENLSYNKGADKFTAKISVKNTGSVDGKAALQLYAQLPYTEYDKTNGVEKSAIQLLDFDKVDVKAGATVTKELQVDGYFLAAYDSKTAKGYILEPGDYYFAVGNGAHEALNNVLALKGATGLVDHDGKSVTGEAKCAKKWNPGLTDVDKTTYKNSKYNKEATAVTNRFDTADVNYWVNDGEKIKYLTRNAWDTTYPVTLNTITVNDKLYAGLNMETYQKPANSKKVSDFKLGQKLETKINFVDMKDIAFDDPKWEQFLSQLTLHDLLQNMGDSKGITSIKAVNKPMCAIVDGPEGMNGQFKYGDKRNCTGWATPPITAASWDKNIQRRYGEMYGEDGLYASIPIAYAPGTNIIRSPYSGRSSEYFSEDGMLNYYAAANVVYGMRSKGLIGTIKHCFLNEQEAGRQGISTFANEQSIREIYLRAFEGAFTKGEGLGVMTAYNRIGVMYAAASQDIEHVLRKEWNYGGYIIDDALSASKYSSAPEMLMAGNNVFCLDTARPASLEKYINDNDDGNLVEKVIESNHYIYYMMLKSSMGGISANTVVSDSLMWWQWLIVIADILFGLAAAGAVAMFVLNTYVWKKGE